MTKILINRQKRASSWRFKVRKKGSRLFIPLRTTNQEM